MLKAVQVGKTRLPVPVPILFLADAIDWVENTIVREEGTLTKVVLDGREIDDFYSEKWLKIKLSKNTNLEVQVDSPWNICLEILGAVADFSEVISRNSHNIAVEIWNLHTEVAPRSILGASEDIHAVVSLVEHFAEIVDQSQVEVAGVIGQKYILRRQLSNLKQALKKRDWKMTARILVRRISPSLRDLLNECERLQVSMMASKTL